MVASEAKPLALHQPMTSTEVEALWGDFERIADKYQVKLFKEANFPSSILFDKALTAEKTVVVIYRGDRITQYEQWKQDLNSENGSPEQLARRLGRLLGYTPQGINNLLSENSDYKSLASSSVIKQITHLYYEDLPEAIQFYSETFGLTPKGESIFQISTDTYIQLHALTPAHTEGQPRSTAIAFLTDQLPAWYSYFEDQNIKIKYTYKPKEGGPHDGFVAIDPGGYLLEIEQFKQHPENELFIAKLEQTTPISTSTLGLNFYGSITWTYHKDLLLMQRFYEEVLGFRLVADQGWTKIYQTSTSGFIGLVDERRGMENYADKKAVEIEWKIKDHAAFDDYASKAWRKYQYENHSLTGPENYIYNLSADLNNLLRSTNLKMSPKADESERTVTIKRTFDAPLALVWTVWTSTEHIVHWWGPQGMKTEIVASDFRLGGRWKYTMQMPDGNEFVTEGQYLEIVEKGKIISSADFKPMTEEVEIQSFFEETGEKTNFCFKVLHPTKEYCKQQTEMGILKGWNSVFDRIEMLLKNLKS